jgi:hypothetical protein
MCERKQHNWLYLDSRAAKISELANKATQIDWICSAAQRKTLESNSN